MKLTSIDNAPYVNLNSLIHIVNTGDTTQSPDGSSYKAPLSDLSPLFGGGGDSYWSASTGTNAIVLSNSGSLANGTNAVAEGINTTAGAYAAKSSGYNSKALGVTSFVHSTNSTVNSGAHRSVILGGQSIIATDADTVYVPNLNINSTPSTDNALTNIIARANDGTIKIRDVDSIGKPNTVVIDNSSIVPYTVSSPNTIIINRRTTGPRTEIILPSTTEIGDYIEIIEDKSTTNPLRVRANTGQTIRAGGYGLTSSGGYIQTDGIGDNISIKLTCITNNTKWGVSHYFSEYYTPGLIVN